EVPRRVRVDRIRHDRRIDRADHALRGTQRLHYAPTRSLPAVLLARTGQDPPVEAERRNRPALVEVVLDEDVPGGADWRHAIGARHTGLIQLKVHVRRAARVLYALPGQVEPVGQVDALVGHVEARQIALVVRDRTVDDRWYRVVLRRPLPE